MQLPGLRRARLAALLTQAELARKANTTRMTIYRLENLHTPARISTVRRLAEALGVPAAELTGGETTTREEQER